MKEIATRMIGFVAVVLFFVPAVYSAETEGTASGSGRDPTAALLIEQGEQLITENQMEGALASFDLAIEVDPTLSKAYFQASAVASQMGNIEKAISYMEALRKRNPNNMETQRLLADLERRRNRVDPIQIPASGFFEFGVLALIGLGFSLLVAGYEFGGSRPAGMNPEETSVFQSVEKPYLIYPLLKVIWQGTAREFLAIHEKRHRGMPWHPKPHAS